mgnify:CR=1 FL=1
MAAAAEIQSEDRFAAWPRGRARLGLLALVLLLLAAVLTPVTKGAQRDAEKHEFGEMKRAPTRSADLAVYDHAAERIAKGENYYAFIAEEHRAVNYPLRPGVAVRLPTLAYLNAWLGPTGSRIAALALLAAVLAVWWRRLGESALWRRWRHFACALLFAGCSLGLTDEYLVLHEMWTGLLLALAFGLHRPGRWGGALLAAGLALAIREHALPFVLLMGAMALWRRDWKEAAAWGLLVALFFAGLAWHMAQVAALLRPDDPVSLSWWAFRGLSGWTSNVVLSGVLRYLPKALAAALVVLMVAGWAGWKSPAGAFGTLLFLGYGVMFMIVGRVDNFYWGAVIAPAMFMGLVFAPRAVVSLTRAAFPRS